MNKRDHVVQVTCALIPGIEYETFAQLVENAIGIVDQVYEKLPAKEPKTRVNLPSEYGENFNRFWKEYPKNNGAKHGANKAWLAIDDSDELMSEIMAGLEACIASDRWQEAIKQKETKWIPHAATWLSQRRWEDAGDIDTSTHPFFDLLDSTESSVFVRSSDALVKRIEETYGVGILAAGEPDRILREGGSLGELITALDVTNGHHKV